MFVFIYFFVVVLINSGAPAFLYHPCDPSMADKAGIIYLIASAVCHLLLFEAGRLTGLVKKRRLVLEIFMLIGVIFASLFFVGLTNFNPVCVDDSVVKNKLFNGVKECAVADANNLPTNFESVQSFRSESTRELRNFKIIKTSKNSCFNARAVPKKELFTWFEIELNTKTGNVSKTCGDSSKRGCNKGNTW